jgi:branched-chain amino acid transport system substrate-binding protein
VQDVGIDGVTGRVTFDEFGDTTTRILTVYKIDGQAWKPQKTDEFK